MVTGLDTGARSESKPSAVRFLAPLDRWLALIAAAILVLLILTASRAKVAAEKVAGTATSGAPTAPLTLPPPSSGERPAPPKRTGELGSEFMLIPPSPMVLREVPLKAIYVA